MDIDFVIVAFGLLLLTINILMLFLCTKILQSIGSVLKECAKFDMKKYVSEEKPPISVKASPETSPVVNVKIEDSLYRNKDGKLSYKVYDENKKQRQTKNGKTIDIDEEFETVQITGEKENR